MAENLMREFDEPFQLYLDGDLTLEEFLTTAQDAWIEHFQE